MKLINGRARAVLLLGNYAIKLAHPMALREGLRENKTELEHGTKPNRYLAPVLFGLFGGLIIVMARCTPIKSLEEREVVEFFKGLYRSGHPVIDLIEVSCPDNFGYLNDMVVALDYGAGGQDSLNRWIIETDYLQKV